jgi:hypothetical protein
LQRDETTYLRKISEKANAIIAAERGDSSLSRNKAWRRERYLNNRKFRELEGAKNAVIVDPEEVILRRID